MRTYANAWLAPWQRRLERHPVWRKLLIFGKDVMLFTVGVLVLTLLVAAVFSLFIHPPRLWL